MLSLKDTRIVFRLTRDAENYFNTLGTVVLKWVEDTFGSWSTLPNERILRLLEETVELAQACGIKKDMVLRIVDSVYSKRGGEINQEVAGVGLRLIAFSRSCNFNLKDLMEQEFYSILTRTEEIKEKQLTKMRKGLSSQGVE